MSITGAFRQHWGLAGKTFPEILHFNNPNNDGTQNLSAVDHIQGLGNLFADDGVNNNRMTIHFWFYPIKQNNWNGDKEGFIYDTVDINGGALNIRGNGFEHFFPGGSLDKQSGNNTPQLFTYNQWNHVLISMQLDNTSVSYGRNSGNYYMDSNNRVNRTSTGDSHRYHIVVNNVGKHRYYQANAAGEDQLNGSGFFQNDFATNPNDPTGGTLTITSNTALSTGNDTGLHKTFFGVNPNFFTNPDLGNDSFNGHLYQFWMSDVYYDLTNSDNIDLFVNTSGSSVTDLPNLPASPKLYIAGGAKFSSGSTDPDGTIITNNGVGKSVLAKP